MVFEINEIIRFSQTDKDLLLKITEMLYFFQDVATLQAEELGVGLSVLEARKMGWFLISWNIEIKRLPAYGEKVVIGTYPYQFRGMIGHRNCYLKTLDGEVLIKADSMWALTDKEKGRMVSIPEDIRSEYELGEPLSMTYLGRKIDVPDSAVAAEPIVIRPDHIDFHGHVNNAQYVQMVLGNVNKGDIRRLRVEYKKQTTLGEVLTPYIAVEGKTTTIALRTDEPHVVVQFETES